LNASERRHRRSIRLRVYDYAMAGAYFVTICATNVTNLERCADIIQTAGNPGHFATVRESVVMPNHSTECS
jgi:hypothetical protein